MNLILNLVGSLRSGLARNAIVAIGDMYKHLTRYGNTMEGMLQFVVSSQKDLLLVSNFSLDSKIAQKVLRDFQFSAEGSG